MLLVQQINYGVYWSVGVLQVRACNYSTILHDVEEAAGMWFTNYILL